MFMYMCVHVYTYINVNAYHGRGKKAPKYKALSPPPQIIQFLWSRIKTMNISDHYGIVAEGNNKTTMPLEEVYPPR